MDLDTIATDFVAQHGKGTYQCDGCAHEGYVIGEAYTGADDRLSIKRLLEHARFDHVSPCSILRIEYTILLNTAAL